MFRFGAAGSRTCFEDRHGQPLHYGSSTAHSIFAARNQTTTSALTGNRAHVPE
jgi:hypothetical protein